MRNAQSSEGSDRLTSYYEFQARQVKRSEVALDVIDFEVIEQPESTMEVQEQQFDSMDELLAHVKQVMGELE
jgi:CO dehydrogenase/acetyl-CoA synthase delta subunit